jgi:hypothetical protein
MNHLTEEQLNEYLDHESAEHAQIEAHIGSCDDCWRRLAALQALFTELDLLPEAALSRDLASSVVQRVSRPGVLPKWLTLTLTIQAALALVSMLVATPLVIEFMNQVTPAFRGPSFPQVWAQLQTQWIHWLNTLSTFQMPSLPAIATPQFSSVVMLSALTSVSVFWLVGNGLLLRNQIK